jgi:hypothetical protein
VWIPSPCPPHPRCSPLSQVPTSAHHIEHYRQLKSDRLLEDLNQGVQARELPDLLPTAPVHDPGDRGAVPCAPGHLHLFYYRPTDGAKKRSGGPALLIEQAAPGTGRFHPTQRRSRPAAGLQEQSPQCLEVLPLIAGEHQVEQGIDSSSGVGRQGFHRASQEMGQYPL